MRLTQNVRTANQRFARGQKSYNPTRLGWIVFGKLVAQVSYEGIKFGLGLLNIYVAPTEAAKQVASLFVKKP